MIKICVECNKEFEYIRATGVTTKHCATCISRVNRKKVFTKIEEYVGGFKCAICGYNRCKRALSFHHKDPTTKSFTVSQEYWFYSWDKVRKEIDKCILLCANCHAEVESKIIEI